MSPSHYFAFNKNKHLVQYFWGKNVRLLSRDTTNFEKKSLYICLKILDEKNDYNIKNISELLKNLSLEKLYTIGKSLGFFIGDFLYDNFYYKKNRDFELIKKNIFFQKYSLKNFLELLNSIFPKDGYKNLKKRVF